MSNAARKARKRANEQFTRTPKTQTVAYTSKAQRQALVKEANEKRKADIAARHRRNDQPSHAAALLPRKGAR